MKNGDPHHQEDMAKNMEIQVQFLTDTRVIAEFLESIIILEKKYECKTYTSPFDGIVDIVNASQDLVCSLNPDQLSINKKRMSFMQTASVTDAPDHLFGEPIENPGDPKLDPRTLTAQQ